MELKKKSYVAEYIISLLLIFTAMFFYVINPASAVVMVLCALSVTPFFWSKVDLRSSIEWRKRIKVTSVLFFVSQAMFLGTLAVVITILYGSIF